MRNAQFFSDVSIKELFGSVEYLGKEWPNQFLNNAIIGFEVQPILLNPTKSTFKSFQQYSFLFCWPLKSKRLHELKAASMQLCRIHCLWVFICGGVSRLRDEETHSP